LGITLFVGLDTLWGELASTRGDYLDLPSGFSNSLLTQGPSPV